MLACGMPTLGLGHQRIHTANCDASYSGAPVNCFSCFAKLIALAKSFVFISLFTVSENEIDLEGTNFRGDNFGIILR